MDAYEQIAHKGDTHVKDLLKDGNIIVEEKIDGSQFRIQINPDGELIFGSHRISPPSNMFKNAIISAKQIFENFKPKLTTYVFCEFLDKPKHNTIKYKRTPKNNLILFDVKEDTFYLNRRAKERFAIEHNMEIVPLLWEGDVKDFTKELEKSLLNKTSILGYDENEKIKTIEGFVIKNYDKKIDISRFRNFVNSTDPFLCMKIVNKEFTEVNTGATANSIENLKKRYYDNNARYVKAIQHLKEDSLLDNEMHDLNILIEEVHNDIEKEEKEYIKEELWNIYKKSIMESSTKKLPIFYKNYLKENGFLQE